jgi:tetratricopeptide (TPR) repeat protein
MLERALRTMPGQFTSRKLRIALYWVFLAVIFLSSCSRDPNVRKQKFVAQGDAFFKEGKYPEAQISYSRALQIDSRYVDALYKSALCYERLGNWNGAFQVLRRAVDLAPDNMDAQFHVGKIYLGAGHPQEAKEHALLILRSNPKNVDAAILLSSSDGALGNQKAALSEARDAVSIDPNHSSAYLNLALLQQKWGAYSEAEASYQKAQSTDPNSVEPRMYLGGFYESQKRLDDARKQFEAAIQSAPKNPAPRSALATLYFAQGQIDQAEKVLVDAKAQMPDVPAGYRMLGDFYIARNDSQKALAEFSSLLSSHPNDLAVKKTYIQLLVSAHKLDQAIPLNDSILKNGPDADALVLRGEIQVQQKKPDDAIVTLQEAVKNSPDNYAGHLQLGYAYQLKGNSDQAETEWRKTVQLQPKSAEAWRSLAGLAGKRRDWNELQSIGAQLMKIAPNAPEGYIFHATARGNQGDVRAAEADLNRLIQSAPQNPVGYIQLGLLRTQQKRWADADSLFHQALAHDARSFPAQEALATLDFQRGQPAAAVERIKDQLQKSPDDAGLAFLLGQAQLRNSQQADAEQSFARAVELAPSNPGSVLALAGVQVARGETDAAISSYKRAIPLAPSNVQIVVALGTLYEAKGDWQQAQSSYQQALSMQSDNAFAANNLAYLLLEHGGDVNVALGLAQVGRRGMADSATSADTLAWAYFHTGAFSLATPLLQEAIQKVPANPTYRYHLGMVYQKMNDPAHARAAFEAAIKAKPDSPAAQDARKALGELAGT